MAHKHFKRFPATQGKMQMRTATRYYYTSMGVAEVKKCDTPNTVKDFLLTSAGNANGTNALHSSLAANNVKALTTGRTDHYSGSRCRKASSLRDRAAALQ